MTAIDPADSVNLLADFETIYGADLVGATVMRVRGFIAVGPNGTNTQQLRGAAGLQVIDGSAFVGAPVQLGPLLADRYGEWFGYFPFGWPDTGANAKTPSWIHIPVDVRAKRRIDELRQMLLLGIEIDPAFTTAAYTFNLSILIALP